MESNKMYNSFLDDFKNVWNKPNNTLPQIIIINVIIFFKPLGP